MLVLKLSGFKKIIVIILYLKLFLLYLSGRKITNGYAYNGRLFQYSAKLFPRQSLKRFTFRVKSSDPIYFFLLSSINFTQIVNFLCLSRENYSLYILNLKCAPFNTIFRLHNIPLVFSTCQHKFKWILCTEKRVLNASFQDFCCTNINNHLICFEKKQ